MDRECVLLTDGATRAALAMTRSLGRAGHRIHVASIDGRSLAGASRWCRMDHATGNATSHPEEWTRRIETLAQELGACVVPVTEVAIGSLLAFGSGDRVDLIAPPRTDYEAAVDKYGLVERARRLGIDVPESRLIEELGSLKALPEPFRYPVIAKPRRSRVLADNKSWQAPPVHVVRDSASLGAAIASWVPADGDFVLQEFVPGHGEGLFALCEQGRIKARFGHRRLREKPPLGGVSVLRESIEVPQDVGHASELLLADLGFTGLAMVEYRRAPDGRLVLMEINPRPWGSLQLAIDAGIDFPRLMVEAGRTNRSGAMLPPARIGVRTRWLLGDVDHLLLCARSRTLRRELGTSLPRVAFEFLRSFFDGSRLEVLRADDWRPFRRELGAWIRGLRWR